MDKIPVKQIEGAVDKTTQQDITARKHFLAGVSAQGGTTGHIPVLHNGYLYYVRNEGQFQDNDFRLGVSITTGTVTLEQLVGGQWLTTCLNGCFQSSSITYPAYGSVAYGTSITLSSGVLKLAEDIQLGDMVKAITDVASLYQGGLLSNIIYIAPSTTPDKVIGIQKNRFEYYYKINTTFKISEKHHVLVNRAGVYQFTRIDHVVVGDKILHYSNGWIMVNAIEKVNLQLDMVSLKLENFDTYLAQNFVLRTVND